jgi:hypothetical protein
MTAAAQALVGIVDGIPEDKQREIVDFGWLLQQPAGDREWERIIADKRAHSRLDRLFADALRESRAEPLNPAKLLQRLGYEPVWKDWDATLSA